MKQQQKKQQSGSICVDDFMGEDIFTSAGLVTLSLLNLGKVTRYSSSFIALVKANMNDPYCMVGDNINSFIPSQIKLSHDDMIRRYIDRGSCVLIRTGDLLFPYLTKQGFIIKVNIQFTLNTWIYEDFLVDACVFSKPLNSGFIVTDLQGYVDNTSEKFYSFLLDRDKIKSDNYNMAAFFQNICVYLPSLLELFFFGGVNELCKQGRVTKTLTFIKPSPELLHKPRNVPGGLVVTQSSYLQYFNRFCNQQKRIFKQSNIKDFQYNYKIVPMIKRYYQREINFDKAQLFQVDLALTVFTFNNGSQDILLVDLYSMKYVSPQFGHKELLIKQMLKELDQLHLDCESQLMTQYSRSQSEAFKSMRSSIADDNKELASEEIDILSELSDIKEEDLYEQEDEVSVEALKDNIKQVSTFITSAKKWDSLIGPKYDENDKLLSSHRTTNLTKNFTAATKRTKTETQVKPIEKEQPNLEKAISSEFQSRIHNEVQLQQEGKFAVDEDRSSVSATSQRTNITMLIKNAYLQRKRVSSKEIIIIGLLYILIILIQSSYDMYRGKDGQIMVDILKNIRTITDLSTRLCEMSLSINERTLAASLGSLSNSEKWPIQSMEFLLKDSFNQYMSMIQQNFIDDAAKYDFCIQEIFKKEITINYLKDKKLNQSFTQVHNLYEFLTSNYPQIIASLQKDQNFSIKSSFIISGNQPNLIQIVRALADSTKQYLFEFAQDKVWEQLLIFMVTQTFIFFLIGYMLYYLLTKIKKINRLLGTLQKFNNTDIDNWLKELDDKQYIKVRIFFQLNIQQLIFSQNAYTQYNKEESLVLDYFKKNLLKKTNQFKFKENCSNVILSILLFFYLPVFLIPRLLYLQSLNSYFKDSQLYMTEFNNVESLIPFSLQYLSQEIINIQLALNGLQFHQFDRLMITQLYESLTSVSSVYDLGDENQQKVKQFIQLSLCDKINITKINDNMAQQLESYLKQQCTSFLDGIIDLGYIRLASRVRQMFQDFETRIHPQQVYELSQEIVFGQDFQDIFMTYVGIKDFMGQFSDIIMLFFDDMVILYVEVNLIINAIEISLAATFLMGFLVWKYISLSTIEKTAWSLIQIFPMEMLQNNEYFKTFLNREKSIL